ncbi:MAG: hypothetical protein MSA15_06380 [Clostridium sp.]|nr:hypothetical protein [Clostridium sp.]
MNEFILSKLVKELTCFLWVDVTLKHSTAYTSTADKIFKASSTNKLIG